MTQPYPSSAPWSSSCASDFSLHRMGEVRFVPITALFATSIRMKAGAPISSGRPFPQSSPGAQSNACTGAQIRTREPSKSPAIVGAAPSAMRPIPTTTPSRLTRRAPSLDGIAATLQARRERPVVGVDGLLLLRLGRLLLLRLLLAGPSAAGHGADDGAGRRACARVTGDRADDSAAGGATRRAAQPLPSADGRALRGRGRRGNGHRINPGRLLRPDVTLGLILLLLLGGLPFGRVDDRLLGLRARRRQPAQR